MDRLPKTIETVYSIALFLLCMTHPLAAENTVEGASFTDFAGYTKCVNLKTVTNRVNTEAQ